MSKFQCGCDVPDTESLRGDVKLSTLMSVTYDAEGFLTCFHHRMRRHGWRSRMSKQKGGGWDHSFDGWTDLEYERYVLYDVLPERPSVEINRNPMPDQRINGNAESIGRQIQARLLADKESGRKPRPASEAADRVLAAE